MRLWVNKCIDECPVNEFENAYVFSIKREGSTIFTGLNNVWLMMGKNEYPKLRDKQKELCKMFTEEYPNQNSVFVSFTANSRAPINKDGLLRERENTSRGRSLLFLCAAVTVAGIIGDNTTIYIYQRMVLSV